MAGQNGSMGDNLMSLVARYMDTRDVDLVARALEYARDAHQECDERLDGSKYIDHAIRVATMLANLRMPGQVVAAGVMHDVLKPKYSRYPDLERLVRSFDRQTAELVAAATQLGRLGPRALQRPNIGSETDGEFISRRLPWVVRILNQQPLAVVIKLADRLENFESLHVIDGIRQAGFAAATMRVFVPCTEWLGMWGVRRQLEDAAFQVLQPAEYSSTVEKYRSSGANPSLRALREEMEAKLADAGLVSSVSDLARSCYSLYRDEFSQGGAELPPLAARPQLVLCADAPSCYRALGVIHATWLAKPGQLIDYISRPKRNGYRSLHTVVETLEGSLPIVIRTHRMNVAAELGIVAQWHGIPPTWLPELPEPATAPEGRIAVYNTEGELVLLDKGATPVDFALKICPELGLRCVRSLVNEQLVSLNHELETGDLVRVSASQAEAGSPGLLFQYVNLEASRRIIALAVDEEQKEQAAATGWELIVDQLALAGLVPPPSQEKPLLREAAHRLDYGTRAALLKAVQEGEISAELVARHIREATGALLEGRRPRARVVSLGDRHLELRYARCCRPQPPDEIVGYVTNRNRITIHQAGCGNLRNPSKIVAAEWEPVPWQKTGSIELVASDREALAADIGAAVAEFGISMAYIHGERCDDGSAVFSIGVGEVPADRLEELLAKLRAVPSVRDASPSVPSVASIMAPDGALSRAISNPYTLLPVTGNRFYGRSQDMTQLLGNLRDLKRGESVLLWGQRRIGKTSLLRHFQEAVLRSHGCAAVYVDVLKVGGGTVSEFLSYTIEQVVAELKNPDVVAPSAAAFVADPLREFKRVLRSVYDFDTRQLVILFDEFEYLSTLRPDGVELEPVLGYLRSLMLDGAPTSFIFCGGGSLRTLLTATPASSVLNVTRHQRVECLDPKAARELISESILRLHYTEDALRALLDKTGCHPYYIQLVCSRLVSVADDEKRTEIDRKHVDDVVYDWLVRQPDQHFDHYWGAQTGLSVAQRQLNLKTLVKVVEGAEENGWTPLARILSRAGNGKSGNTDYRNGLASLLDLDTLEYTNGRYRIESPVLELWIRANSAEGRLG